MTMKARAKTTTSVRYLRSMCHPFAGVSALWDERMQRLKLQCGACRNPVVSFKVLKGDLNG